MKLRLIAATVLSCALFAYACTVADARPRAANGESAHCVFSNDGRSVCGRAEYRTSGLPRASAQASNRQIIGGRPAGCPHRYCGCGLRKYLGISDTRLNLAWNWAKLFPRTQAQAGAAAVRRGHVMLLQEHVGGTRWIVRDYNGGRGLSYIHERDVRGFVFVQPGHRLASQ